MKLITAKNKLMLHMGEEGVNRGIKIEVGRVGWIGFVFRRDVGGFTLNFFLIGNLHLSWSSGRWDPDQEVKAYGGYIWPKAGEAIWMWRWNGGGSELARAGTMKSYPYMDRWFGKTVFSEKVVTRVLDWPLEMPEGPYYLDVTIERGKWTRPRWPFSRKRYRARIEVSNGGEIPVPLKDGTETGTYGETRNNLKSGSLNKVLRDYKFDLLRERHFVAGDEDWRPKNAEIGKARDGGAE